MAAGRFEFWQEMYSHDNDFMYSRFRLYVQRRRPETLALTNFPLCDLDLHFPSLPTHTRAPYHNRLASFALHPSP